MWCVVVWARNLMNEDDIARVGVQCPKNFKVSVKSVDVWTAQISELHDDGKERKPKHVAVIIKKTYATILY